MAKNSTRSHHWVDGELQVIEHWFESLEEAYFYAQNTGADHIKVYNEDGELEFEGEPGHPDTFYA
jgi:hypothetical protein